MKKFIYNSKEENINKKKENNRGYYSTSNFKKNYPSIEKKNPNLKENSSYKQIKKIKNISFKNQTFYPSNNLVYSKSSYLPIHLSTMPKTKKFLVSLNKISNIFKLNQAKTISEKTMEKTMYNNNSSVKLSDNSIYLPREFMDLTVYKKMFEKFPKSKYFYNTKVKNINKIKFNNNKNEKHLLLKSSSEINVLNIKKIKNFSENTKKYINLYNPKKILQYNTKNKTEDPPPPIIKKNNELENSTKANNNGNNNINLNKKFHNIISKKIKTNDNISIDCKEESIKKDNEKTNKESLLLKLDNCIKNTSIKNITNINNNVENIIKNSPIKNDEEKNQKPLFLKLDYNIKNEIKENKNNNEENIIKDETIKNNEEKNKEPLLLKLDKSINNEDIKNKNNTSKSIIKEETLKNNEEKKKEPLLLKLYESEKSENSESKSSSSENTEKEDTIKNDDKTNKEPLLLKLDDNVKNETEENMNNGSKNIKKNEIIKEENKNNTVLKLDLSETPKKIKKINDEPLKNKNENEIPKIKGVEFNKTIRQNTNNIENGGLINLNNYINNFNNSTNKLLYISAEYKKIKEGIIRNENKYKSEIETKRLILNEILKNKRKIKYENLIVPIKKDEINNKNNCFLNKIKQNNEIEGKLSVQNVNIKKRKKLILNAERYAIQKDIINSNNKIKLYHSSNLQENIEEFKDIYYHYYITTDDKREYFKTLYNELKHDSLISILVYSYILIVNKCILDQNTINYLLLNNCLSSLFVPLVDVSHKRTSVFMRGKLFLITKKTYFQDKKSKFIESKQFRKIFENTYSHFIYKEFISLYLEKNNRDYLCKDNTYNKNKFIRKTYKSYTRKQRTMTLRKLLSCNNTRSSQKKLTYFDKSNAFNKAKKDVHNLSILQRGQIFETPKTYNVHSIKNIGRRRTLMNGHFQRKSVRTSSLHYFDLIKKMRGNNNFMNVLKDLIKKREIYLFMEYVNSHSREIDLNYQDEDGNTFLIIAIKHGLFKLAKFLLEKGINIDIQNKEGNSALHYALSSKNFLLADLLRKFGAIENSVNKLGYTPWDSIGKNIEFDSLY